MRCLESARLLSERRDHSIGWRRRLGLRLHLWLCALCRTYDRQLTVVCTVSHQAGREPSSHAPALPADRRQEIHEAIHRD